MILLKGEKDIVNKLKDNLALAYENFLMRDLTYVFAGVLILLSLKYAYDGKVIDTFEYITLNWIRILIFFIGSYFIGLLVKEALTYGNFSYRIKNPNKGKNIFEKCPWWYNKPDGSEYQTYIIWPWWFTTWHRCNEKYEKKKDKFILIEKDKGFYTIISDLLKKYGPDIIRRLERTTYFVHIGASFGTASFIGFQILFWAHVYRLLGWIKSINYSFEYSLFLISLPILFLFCLWYNHQKIKEFNGHLDYLMKDL
jgi:hypothetical protein